MSVTRHHAEWMSLVEVSGPFLSMPVLLDVFPDGLDQRDDASELRERLHTAYEEWLDDQGGTSPDPAIHQAWVRYVLRELLELDEDWLVSGQALPPSLAVPVAEHGEVLRPAFAVLQPEGRPNAGKPRLLIEVLARAQDPERALDGKPWKVSPATRMMTLLHGAGVRLGLVTNGEEWMLVHAKPGDTTSNVSFYANLLFDEPLTLRAFASLCGAQRLFNVPDDQTLEALFDRSSEAQQELTDQLGYQVRRAVEVLVQSIDRVDRDRQGELLRRVDEKELYEAACTIMMRLVFLLAAEERELLLLGDPMYDQNYAISTLRDALQEAADKHGKEVLRHRYDAFARLLSTFRAVHAGVRHARMRLPAYGGSLFHPDRYPFLEGRAQGTSWKSTPAAPLPIDNLTVLDLLTAIQVLEVQVRGRPAEARRLSFRALDVEQIGHVYEGLLDHTAKRAHSPVVSLSGAKNVEPEVPLDELEAARKKGQAPLVEYLREVTGRTQAALERALEYEVPDDEARRLLVACDNARPLYERVKPWVGLVRKDAHEQPVIYAKGAVYVTEGLERRQTGTHYTPPSLTEPIVRHALEPLVYRGPAEGWEREKWKLRPARDLLALRVCDPAMGSGAFLVQACRYLSVRLVEAWEAAEREAGGRLVVTPEGELSQGRASERPLPRDAEERLAIARRVVADRCLFGVDKNPMATEMGKLSLWLVTLQKDRPFTFVDHALRSGDSLLGLTRLEQIEAFHIDPARAVRRDVPLFDPGRVARKAVERAMLLRQKLESFSVESLRDAEEKSRLLAEATAALDDARLIADVIIAAALASAPRGDRALDTLFEDLALIVMRAYGEGSKEDHRIRAKEQLRARARELLDEGRGAQHAERLPFHWVLEFPEVLAKVERGFDAFVGNPPFQGGQRITGALGTDYRDYLVTHTARGARGSADLCAYFFLRAGSLARDGASVGMLATNTIAQGDTREVGLDQLVASGFSIPRAVPSRKWPGTANLEVAHVWLHNGAWAGEHVLDERPTTGISSQLAVPGAVQGKPHRLAANAGKSFQGSIVLGMGFVLAPEEAQALIKKDKRNKDVLFPYLNGQDLNSNPDQSPSRWVINFRDWPLSRKSAPEGYRGPVAADFPDCLKIVEEKVKPERANNPRKVRRERWWQFAERASALYKAIEGMERVLVHPLTTKHNTMAFYPPGIVMSHMTVVLAFDSWWAYGMLQSEVHWAWALQYGNKLETRPQYTPTDCFEPFPFPAQDSRVERAATSFAGCLFDATQRRGEGLTDTFNRLADPNDREATTDTLREALAALDRAVLASYQWEDVDPGHGFHASPQGTRFTIADEPRREILDRLLGLNHERYAEETRQGLHKEAQPSTRGSAPKGTRTAPKRAAPAPSRAHQTGFAFTDPLLQRTAPATGAKRSAQDEARAELSRPARALLKACEKANDPLGKADLLEAAKLDDSEWSAAIRELLDAKLVRQGGEGRGTKYVVRGGNR
ncbi:MAG: hypothetical protein IT377_13280 [Polyangiaceae bacterium]|nr:hypothetical protein [Polyangiaceae bacterium]